MPQGQTTPEKTLSNPWHGKGFCEPNQYRSAIDRCEGGYKSMEIGIDMFKRLHKIIEQFSENLHEWSVSSQKQIAESKEFGTNRKTWMQCIQTVEKMSEQNDLIAKGIQEKIVDKMTTFKHNQYGKSFIHVKKIKEFDHDFKKVQKPWLEYLEKINDAKLAYHDAKRRLNQAKSAQAITESDVGSTDEQKKKVKTSVDKRQGDTDGCKAKYQRLIDDAETKKITYEKDMFAILDRTDTFEKERLTHFNSIFKSLQEVVLVDNKENQANLLKGFTKAIDEHKIDEDIEFFNRHYGRKTDTKWPVFEEIKE